MGTNLLEVRNREGVGGSNGVERGTSPTVVKDRSIRTKTIAEVRPPKIGLSPGVLTPSLLETLLGDKFA